METETFLRNLALIVTAIAGLMGLIKAIFDIRKQFREDKSLTSLFAQKQIVFGLVLAIIGIVAFAFWMTARISSVSLKATPSPSLELTFTNTPEPATPNPTATENPSVTPIPPSDTLSPSPTNTSTPSPTFTLTPTATLILQQDCISTKIWQPYKIEIAPTVECLQLEDKGIAALDNGLTVFIGKSNQIKQYGVYTPINGNLTIEFNLKIDQFDTGGSIGYLSFGVIPTNPLDTLNGGFIFYQIESINLPVLQFTGNPFDKFTDNYFTDYVKSSTQKIAIRINTLNMDVFINNEKITVEPIPLPFTERAFLIYYSLPRNSALIATIEDLSIK